MEDKIKITLKVNQKFDSLYKLGYFLVDINSILTFCNKINNQTSEDAIKPKKYRLGITSRYLNKDSLNDVKIEKFQQGSLILNIISGVISGIILSIIEKYINNNEQKEKINIVVNNQKITNVIVNNYNYQLSLEENINTILKELQRDKLINANGLLYDKDGKKILIKNIERIKGQIVDEKW